MYRLKFRSSALKTWHENFFYERFFPNFVRWYQQECPIVQYFQMHNWSYHKENLSYLADHKAEKPISFRSKQTKLDSF